MTKARQGASGKDKYPPDDSSSPLSSPPDSMSSPPAPDSATNPKKQKTPSKSTKSSEYAEVESDGEEEEVWEDIVTPTPKPMKGNVRKTGGKGKSRNPLGDDSGDDSEDKDYDDGGGGARPKRKRTRTYKVGSFSGNGRVSGRLLIYWHLVRMYEKFLLHLQYESHKDGVKLPYDKAVHRMSPGSSGQAAIQQLAKLRRQLVAEGHLVPPRLERAGTLPPPNIRGFIRDMDGPTYFSTRPVDWNEEVKDRNENLPLPWDVGSGQYRKRQAREREAKYMGNGTSAGKRQKKASMAVKKESEEDDDSADEGLFMGDVTPLKNVRKRAPPIKKTSPSKKAKTAAVSMSALDEDRSSSDDDFGNPTPPRGRGRAAQLKPVKLERTSDDGFEKRSETYYEQISEEDATDDEIYTTPVRPSRMVTLHMDPDRLRQFPEGESRAKTPPSDMSKMANGIDNMNVDTTPSRARGNQGRGQSMQNDSDLRDRFPGLYLTANPNTADITPRFSLGSRQLDVEQPAPNQYQVHRSLYHEAFGNNPPTAPHRMLGINRGMNESFDDESSPNMMNGGMNMSSMGGNFSNQPSPNMMNGDMNMSSMGRSFGNQPSSDMMNGGYNMSGGMNNIANYHDSVRELNQWSQNMINSGYGMNGVGMGSMTGGLSHPDDRFNQAPYHALGNGNDLGMDFGMGMNDQGGLPSLNGMRNSKPGQAAFGNMTNTNQPSRQSFMAPSFGTSPLDFQTLRNGFDTPSYGRSMNHGLSRGFATPELPTSQLFGNSSFGTQATGALNQAADGMDDTYEHPSNNGFSEEFAALEHPIGQDSSGDIDFGTQAFGAANQAANGMDGSQDTQTNTDEVPQSPIVANSSSIDLFSQSYADEAPQSPTLSNSAVGFSSQSYADLDVDINDFLNLDMDNWSPAYRKEDDDNAN